MSGSPQAETVRRFLSARVDEGRIPGAVWLVENATGALDRGAVGSAYLRPRKVATTLDTTYDLASLTKMLATAPLLLLLEQDGLLGLDEPAARRLPELRDSPWSRTTPLELARHTSGLPAWRPLYVRGSTIDSYIEQIVRTPPAVEQGTPLYSDLGFILLGALLERISGKELATLFDERIGRPLGLSHTGFATPQRRFAGAAPTEEGNLYERELAGESGASFRFRESIAPGETHDANAHTLGGAAGHAGLFGVAEEVARLARELFDPRRIGLADPGRRLMLVAGPAGRSVGMVAAGHSRATRGILPDGAPGHTGFTGTSLWLDPSDRGIYLLLTNRVHPRVASGDFQPLRRGFHRAARRFLGSHGRPALAGGPG